VKEFMVLIQKGFISKRNTKKITREDYDIKEGSKDGKKER
jgi:hypothetical protein